MLELRQRYVDALVAGDLALAERLIEDSGTDIRSLYLQVLQPALYEIGRRWQEAEISVAQEHLATATTQSLMARLAGRFDDRAPRRDRRVLVACAEGELHSIGVRMVADFLEADGWDVLFVGALSPPAAVAELATAQRVDVVALSAALGQRVPEIRQGRRGRASARERPGDRRRRPGLRGRRRCRSQYRSGPLRARCGRIRPGPCDPLLSGGGLDRGMDVAFGRRAGGRAECGRRDRAGQSGPRAARREPRRRARRADRAVPACGARAPAVSGGRPLALRDVRVPRRLRPPGDRPPARGSPPRPTASCSRSASP